MNYPAIDPILVEVGPIAIHYYGALYLCAFGIFYLLGRVRLKRDDSLVSTDQFNDLCYYAILGVIIGGRLGYVLFYSIDVFLEDSLWLFRIWEGGMSFHGGLLGVVIALFIWVRRNSLDFLDVMDFVAPLVPCGLGMGRIGNFVNTELPGRVSDFALAAHFPCEAVRVFNPMCIGEFEQVTRHISSIYQAIAEGVVLFAVLWFLSMERRRKGQISGLFLLVYGILRCVTEAFRQPDASIGFLIGQWLTMGQLLSIPMVLIGLVLVLPQTSHYLIREKSI